MTRPPTYDELVDALRSLQEEAQIFYFAELQDGNTLGNLRWALQKAEKVLAKTHVKSTIKTD